MHFLIIYKYLDANLFGKDSYAFDSDSVANGQTRLKPAQPSYPTIPLEPLHREQPLRNIENSGWRE